MTTTLLLLRSVAWIWLIVLSFTHHAAALNLDCDPCIERTNFKIRAIVHGLAQDDYWMQMSAAMHQAAKDMRVDFEMDDLWQVFDPVKMAESIRSLMTEKQEEIPDALIVTIPSNEVREAVKELIEKTKIPVFGMNSGYREAKELGLMCHIAQDEYLAGQQAALHFLKLNYPEWNQTEPLFINNSSTVHRALFINHEFGNTGLDNRYMGFKDALETAVGPDNIVVDQLVLDPTQEHPEKLIAQALEGCPYTDGILAPKHVLEMLTSAYYQNECSFVSQRSGIFDVDSKVYDAIALGKVAFAISQQQYLQGAATVTLAAIYVTTGFQLYFPSSENVHGIYLSGPNLVELKNLPSDSQQICESEGFPVCLKDGTSPNPQGKCQCQDRSKIRIGGSTPHPESTPSHWGVIWQAARQAGKDAGIDLILDELERPDASESEQDKIGQKYVVSIVWLSVVWNCILASNFFVFDQCSLFVSRVSMVSLVAWFRFQKSWNFAAVSRYPSFPFPVPSKIRINMPLQCPITIVPMRPPNE